MRTTALTLLLALSISAISWGQAPSENPLGHCGSERERGPLPIGPYKLQRNESYKRSPVVKFQINEDGTVSNVTIVRSSGVKDIDRKLLEAVSAWKYKSHPGCPVLDTEMTVSIHW